MRVAPDALAKFRRARDARHCSFSVLAEELLSRVIYDAHGQLVGLHPQTSVESPQQKPTMSA